MLFIPSVSWAMPWWDCSWPYRSEISVTSTQSVNDRVVSVELSGNEFNTAYNLTSNGADLRVLASDNVTALNFNIRQWDPVLSRAIIDVQIPSLTAGTSLTLFLYYGNTDALNASNVSTSSNAPTTYTDSGWRFHAKQSRLNPSNEAQARTEFANANEPGSYGCTVIDSVLGRSKRNTFGGGFRNYALYAETHFQVITPGVWNFRAGVDFGRGGALYINSAPITERWNEDLWWAYNYNNSDVLTGSTTLSSGYHHIELLGFEGCCDGTISVEYLSPGATEWKELQSSNLDLISAGCPVGEQLTQFDQTDRAQLLGGLVFLDNGDGGVAHNAVPEANESGIENVPITIEVVNTGSTQSLNSSSDGSWQTCLFEGNATNEIKISVDTPNDHYSVSEAVGQTNTDAELNGIVQFTAASNTDYLQLHTGFIEFPSFQSSQTGSVGAGVTQLLPHRYISTSTANVRVQVSQRQHSPLGAFNYELYQDSDCNGELDSPAIIFASPVSSTVGQEICMILKVDGSLSVDNASLLELSLDVTSDFDGIDVSHQNTNTDIINGATAAQMILLKSVCNATVSSCDVLSGAGFANEQSGKPNDEMIYRLEFISQLGQLNNVAVYDALPPYTTLKPFSAEVVVEPNGMTCSIAEPFDQSVQGFKGTVKWNCNGQIAESHSGVVAFAVYID